jgi:hypothetical protein
MELRSFHTIEQSHTHDLQLILSTTHSLLPYHRPHIKDGVFLRILDLAILNAVAELQQLDASSSDATIAL